MGRTGQVTLLQQNDTHAYLELHWEHFWRNGRAEYRRAGGYARAATLAKRIKAEVGGACLFVDCGDTIGRHGPGAVDPRCGHRACTQRHGDRANRTSVGRTNARPERRQSRRSAATSSDARRSMPILRTPSSSRCRTPPPRAAYLAPGQAGQERFRGEALQVGPRRRVGERHETRGPGGVHRPGGGPTEGELGGIGRAQLRIGENAASRRPAGTSLSFEHQQQRFAVGYGRGEDEA